MNESHLFVAVTQKLRYHSILVTTATAYGLSHNIVTTATIHSPQPLYTHSHTVTSLPQTQCSDFPPDQHSSIIPQYTTFHCTLRDWNFNDIFFFGGPRQPAPVTLLYVSPQTRGTGTRCLAVNNKGSHVGLNIEWAMTVPGDKMKEITAGWSILHNGDFIISLRSILSWFQQMEDHTNLLQQRWKVHRKA
jgi:hypothetical protein